MKKVLLGITILIGCLLLAGGVFALRNNRMNAYSKVEAITAADQRKEDVSKLLDDLKKYSTTHMNASAHVTLESKYERDVAQAKTDAEAGSRFNIDVYKDAVQACPVKLNSVSAAKCIRDYVDSHVTTGQNPAKPRAIDKANYTYSFVSPRWAWDEAGTLLASGAGILIVSLVTLAVGFFLKLKRSHTMAKPMSAVLPKHSSKKL